jgi:hypothetical protein
LRHPSVAIKERGDDTNFRIHLQADYPQNTIAAFLDAAMTTFYRWAGWVRFPAIPDCELFAQSIPDRATAPISPFLHGR